MEPLALFQQLLLGGLILLLLGVAQDLVADADHGLLGGHAAVADGGVQVVQ